VSRDILYSEQELIPTKFYTKEQGSLKQYDPDWYKPFLFLDIQTKIDALKAEHKSLQEELVWLNLRQSVSPTDSGVKRMADIRTRQKEIYIEVMELKKQLSNSGSANI